MRHLSEDTDIQEKRHIEELVTCYSRNASRQFNVKKKVDAEKKRIETEREMKALGLSATGAALGGPSAGRPKTAFKPEFDDVKQNDDPDDDEDEEDGLSDSLRMMICAQTVNALASSTANAFLLLQYDILKVVGDAVQSVNWERNDGPRGEHRDTRDYAGLLQVCEFLVKLADVGVMLSPENQGQFRARDWSRAAYRICHTALDPALSDNPAPALMRQIREQVFSAVFIRVNAKRCPSHHIDNASAVFEVPGFLNRLVHWFYRREQFRDQGDSAELISEVIDALRLARQENQIPLHHKKALAKALKQNTPCDHCNSRQPEKPMLVACSTCIQAYYCNEDCRGQAWRAGHSKKCKQAYKAEGKSNGR